MSSLNRGSLMLVISVLAFGLVGCQSFRAARLYQRGTAALSAGQSEDAISALDRAGQLAPGASEIQNHLGLAFASAGQHEKALSAFQRAVDLDCSNSAAAHNLVVARALAAGEEDVDGTALGFHNELAELNRNSISVQAP